MAPAPSWVHSRGAQLPPVSRGAGAPAREDNAVARPPQPQMGCARIARCSQRPNGGRGARPTDHGGPPECGSLLPPKKPRQQGCRTPTLHPRGAGAPAREDTAAARPPHSNGSLPWRGRPRPRGHRGSKAAALHCPKIRNPQSPSLLFQPPQRPDILLTSASRPPARLRRFKEIS